MAKQKPIETIYAFEPDPRNYAQLMANAFLNNLTEKLIVYNAAVSSQNGSGEFHLSRRRFDCDFGKFNTSTSSLVFCEPRHSDSQSAIVPVHCLDDLIHLRDQDIALKIDVERHEMNAILGMESLLRENRCVVCIEICDTNVASVDQYLGGLGYHLDQKASGEMYFYVRDRR